MSSNARTLVPKLPVHKFLVNNLSRLQVTGDWDGADELTQAHCQRIADGDFHWNVKDEFGHRFHSNLTQMPRAVKYYRDGGRVVPGRDRPCQ